MSEPVTNVDIEDVLSSIRRLVTEESRGDVKRIKLNPQDLQPVEEVAAKGASSNGPKPFTRLLLTPSLRVVDDAPQAVEQAASPEVKPRIPTQEPWLDPHATLHDVATHMRSEPESAAPRPSVERAPLMLSEAMARPVAEPDPEPEAKLEPETVQPASTEALSEEASPAAESAKPKRRFTEPGMAAEHIVYTSKFAELRSRSDTLKSKIKALEAAIAETPGSWEPDGSGMDDNDQAPIETIPWQGNMPVADVMPEAEEELAPEALEDDALVAPEMDAPEMDAAQDADEPLAEAADDVAEAEDQPAEDFPEDDLQDDLTADEQVEENVLDEAALRQLVAEIVREELQGALGERITRNVRKLVRLEIQRALAAHGLD